MNNDIFRLPVFTGVSIAKSGTLSTTFDMNLYKPSGLFSLQIEETGDGTGKYTYSVSNDNVTFVTPTGADDIVTAFTKTTGPGSDGNDLYGFTPELAAYLRITVLETGGASAILPIAFLAIQ